MITAVAGPDKLILRGPRLPIGDQRPRHVDEFDVAAGDDADLLDDLAPVVRPHAPESSTPAADRADHRRRGASGRAGCHADVPHADVVRRSLLTLRLLTHEQTGGIVAAPTTSLPEDFGGERNWDYRYCWLRDAALTIESLIDAGYTDEAPALAGLAAPGRGRRPRGPADHVRRRRGPAAARAHPRPPARLRGVAPGPDRQRRRRAAADRRARRGDDRARQRPRGRARGTTTTPGSSSARWSTARARPGRSPTTASGRSAARGGTSPTRGRWCGRRSTAPCGPSRTHGLEGRSTSWREVRDAVREEVLTRGFDRERNTFTQHYDTTEVDASLLVLPLDRLHRRRRPADARHHRGDRAGPHARRPAAALPHRDRRRRARRATSTRSWPARSGWSRRTPPAGRIDDAHALFDRLVGLVNDVGLLSEEYDPVTGRMVGNFPQAFSHLTLVQAAFSLAGLSRADPHAARSGPRAPRSRVSGSVDRARR